jgi:hypothetical protein
MAHLAASRALYPQLTPSAIIKIALFSCAHTAKQSAMGSPMSMRNKFLLQNNLVFFLPLTSPVNGL